MEPLFRNNTKLTLDKYKNGVAENFRLSHRFSRAISTAYAIILLFLAFAVFWYIDLVIFAILVFVAGVTLFYFFYGYKIGTKKSFMKFAALHGSHYQVDMEYRFYEERLEQETDKTELAVMYKDIDCVRRTDDIILIVFDKQLILMDASGFEGNTAEGFMSFINEKIK